MEFLKALFENGQLTYEQLAAKVKEAGLNVVNIADGAYVSRNKYNDKTGALEAQVKGLQEQLTQRDADLTELNEKLTAAQADAGQLAEAQKQITALQSKYDRDSRAWEERNAQQAYEYAVRTAAGKEKFSSTAAQKMFVAEAIKQGFKLDGETLLGYNDFLAKYKAEDPGAFAAETPPAPDPAPKIVLPVKPDPGPQKLSLSDAMRMKNENPDIKISFD